MNKEDIASAIKKSMSDKGLSIRKLAEMIGVKHPQVVRVTNGSNYNIDTLIKVLNALDLKIEIKVID
jgi:HTH-type transcriptional regulator / antitoxin HipB